jgi:hypothetical protein
LWPRVRALKKIVNRQQSLISVSLVSSAMVVYGLALGNQRQPNGGDFSTRTDEKASTQSARHEICCGSAGLEPSTWAAFVRRDLLNVPARQARA